MWRFISSWLGFYSEPFLGSFPDTKTATKILFLTLQEVLELLASAFECSHWLLCTTPSRQYWVEQVSWESEKVTLENILVYYYTQKSKINHTRCIWNSWGEGGSAFLILSVFFFNYYLISTFKAVESFSWRVCVCYPETSPGPPNSCP